MQTIDADVKLLNVAYCSGVTTPSRVEKLQIIECEPINELNASASIVELMVWPRSCQLCRKRTFRKQVRYLLPWLSSAC